MNRSQISLFFKLILINTIVSLLLFVTGEVVLRMFTPEWLDYRMRFQKIRARGFRHFASDFDWEKVKDSSGRFLFFKPNSKMTVAHYEYLYNAQIDANGGRLVRQKDSAELGDTTFFLGDSFVFGLGVEDQCTFVQRYADDHSETVLNLGVPGSCLDEQIDILRHRLKSMHQRPKKVIFGFFLGNDFHELLDNQKKIDSDRIRHPENPAADKNESFIGLVNRLANNSMLGNSYFYQFVKQKLLTAINVNAKAKYRDPVFDIMDPESNVTKKGRVLIEGHLKQLSSLSKTYGFRCVFVAIPDRYQIQKTARETMARYYGITSERIEIRRGNRILSDILSEFPDIGFIDPFECLYRIDEESKKALFYTVDNHLTSKGHDVFYACLKDRLRALE